MICMIGQSNIILVLVLPYSILLYKIWIKKYTVRLAALGPQILPVTSKEGEILNLFYDKQNILIYENCNPFLQIHLCFIL